MRAKRRMRRELDAGEMCIREKELCSFVLVSPGYTRPGCLFVCFLFFCV
jgi:hypothetical protein